MTTSHLSNYGPVLVDYSGTGTLQTRTASLPCTFTAGQLCDGTVLVLCYFADLHSDVPSSEDMTFVGATAAGAPVSAELEKGGVNALVVPDAVGTYAAFRARSLTVEERQGVPNSLRFGICNFRFFGRHTFTDLDAQARLRRHGGCVQLTLQSPDAESTSVRIGPIPAYAVVARRVATVRGIEVTAEAVLDGVSGSEQATNGERLAHIISDLCWVLSIARGTKVQWIYRYAYDGGGNLLSRTHVGSRITKRLNRLEPLSHRPEHSSDTLRFVEAGFTRFQEIAEQLHLRGGVVDAYLDARSEDDFLETRGVKSAVAIEMLKALFLRLTHAGARQHQRASNPAGRARPSLKTALRSLCAYVQFEVSERELDLFVRSRNKLIHEGRFYVDAASVEERSRCEPLHTPLEEYFFIVNFVDRLMLKLLGYTGPYVDWSRYPHHSNGTLP